MSDRTDKELDGKELDTISGGLGVERDTGPRNLVEGGHHVEEMGRIEPRPEGIRGGGVERD